MTKHDNVSQEGIMKATEFVKEYGIDTARECLEERPKGWESCYLKLSNFELVKYIPSPLDFIDVDDLKRLVESHELVIVWRMPEAWSGDYDGDVNGLEGANMYLEMYGNYELVGEELERFKQAIADVEACQ